MVDHVLVDRNAIIARIGRWNGWRKELRRCATVSEMCHSTIALEVHVNLVHTRSLDGDLLVGVVTKSWDLVRAARTIGTENAHVCLTGVDTKQTDRVEEHRFLHVQVQPTTVGSSHRNGRVGIILDDHDVATALAVLTLLSGPTTSSGSRSGEVTLVVRSTESLGGSGALGVQKTGLTTGKEATVSTLGLDSDTMTVNPVLAYILAAFHGLSIWIGRKVQHLWDT